MHTCSKGASIRAQCIGSHVHCTCTCTLVVVTVAVLYIYRYVQCNVKSARKKAKKYEGVFFRLKGFFIILASAPLLVWQSGGFDVCFEAC